MKLIEEMDPHKYSNKDAVKARTQMIFHQIDKNSNKWIDHDEFF